MDRLKRILVGIDFSDSSRRALEQALRMASWNGAEVRVFHGVSAQSQSYLPTDAEPRLTELLEDCGADAGVTVEVAVGELLPQTLRLVREWAADVVVIGAYGPLGQFTGSGVGSFAGLCMRHLPCKVLAVHETLAGAFTRILSCVDFSPAADRALEASIRLAQQESGQLHVIHVEPEGVTDPEVGTRLAQRVAELGGGPPLDVHYEILEPTHVGRAIIQYARRLEVHLIALGAKGQGDLEYVLIGSTAENVLRSVRRSVLVTKAAGFVAPADRG